MKKTGLFFVLFSLLSLTCILHNIGDRPTAEASPDVHQGNLTLRDNNVTIIEGRYDINGSIFIEDNATLALMHATLNFTQTKDSQHNIILQNPSNGNPRIAALNSTITSEHRVNIYLYENSTASILDSTLSCYVFAMDSSVLTLLNGSHVETLYGYGSSSITVSNSTVDEWHIYNYAGGQVQANVYASEIDSLLIGPKTVNCTIVSLHPGFFHYWSFIENNSLAASLEGYTPDVTIVETSVHSWRFAFYGSSNATVFMSTLSTLFATDSSLINIESSTCTVATVQASSILQIFDSSLSMLEVGGQLSNWLVNSTYADLYFYGPGRVDVGWYLDAHVVDLLSQDVPYANVTATYLGAVAAEKSTDDNGQARLILAEKTINATGEYPTGNYTVEAKYGTHSDGSSVEMTANRQIELQLDFVIPEFSRALSVLLVMLILLPVAFYRKKHQSRL